MASEDQLLLRAVAKGNHLAFEKLYKEYFAKCYSFALYFTHSEELSKEVVAEVFLGFWKNRESLVNVKSLDSYLYVSIRNQALAMQKKKGGISQEPIELFSVYIAAEGDTPEDVILHEELESLVEKAFARLPERCRMIYYLVREEGKSYRETAEMLGISERTVNSQMTIAKRKLTDLLCDYFSSKRSPLKK